MRSSRTTPSANRAFTSLNSAELCHNAKDGGKINDLEMELAAAWEYSRQLYRSRKKAARIFDRLRKTNRKRNRFLLSPVLTATPLFPNRYALTFLVSPKWPATPFGKLSEKQKRQAFPEAPIYLESLKIPKLGSFMHPVENLTPRGSWASNWSTQVLEAEFSPRPAHFLSKRRLILIDTSYDLGRIKAQLEEIVDQEAPRRRIKGRNPYEAALKDLALLRAQEAGWDSNHFDELWKKAGIPPPKTDQSDKTPFRTACGVAFEARRKRIQDAKNRLKTAFDLPYFILKHPK